MLPTATMKLLPLIAVFFAASALSAQEPAAPPAADAAPAPGTVPSRPTPNVNVPPRPISPDNTAKPAEPPPAALPAEEPLLPLPAEPILDQAGVLRPDAVERLHTALTAARAKDVWIYVLTVPSLQVLPSKQKEKLEATAKRYAKAWTPKTVGAIILFDDEGGLMSMETSKEAGRRFSDVAIQIAMEERTAKLQTEGLAREKLEKITLVAAEALCQLQAQYVEDSRRQRRINLIMGGLAVIGVGLALWSALGGPKSPASPKPEPEIETKPPSAV